MGHKGAVGVHHELAPGQAGVGIWAALDKAATGVQQELHIVRRHTLERQREQLFSQHVPQILQAGFRAMLHRYDHLGNAHGDVACVLHGNLYLAVRANVGERIRQAEDFQQRGKALGGHHRHGHVFGRFIAGIAHHNALIASAEGVIVLIFFQFRLDRSCNVGTLLMDVAVDLVFLGVVANVPQGVAGNVEHIRHGSGGDFTRHDDMPTGRHDLAGHAAGRIVFQTFVQNGIRDEVAQLVRVAAQHGFGGVKTRSQVLLRIFIRSFHIVFSYYRSFSCDVVFCLAC